MTSLCVLKGWARLFVSSLLLPFQPFKLLILFPINIAARAEVEVDSGDAVGILLHLHEVGLHVFDFDLTEFEVAVVEQLVFVFDVDDVIGCFWRFAIAFDIKKMIAAIKKAA